MQRKYTTVPRVCLYCNSPFNAQAHRRPGHGIYCSLRCAQRARFPTPKERFWSKVSKSETCWTWTAKKRPGGYGLFSLGGKMLQAHRVSWTFENGEIPDGMDVCHKCDNPSCVRPDHLFLGTHTDNMHDMIAKGRENMYGRKSAVPKSTRGENSHTAKLTLLQVTEIRRLYAEEHVRVGQLAKLFGVCHSNISLIVHSKRWS
jgi:hypothetical protein